MYPILVYVSRRSDWIVPMKISFRYLYVLFSHFVFHNRYNVYKDHITLDDYEIHDGMNIELYYN